MTYKNLGRALFLLAGFGFAACGGSTTINFVGDPDSTGGEGGEGTGGNDGDGGDNLGGLGGDGSGGAGTGGGSGGGIIVLGYCGDGTISAADDEICDDGNERSGDGCSAACIVEPPFACFGEPSVCSTCGNGTHDSGEGCDDGNAVDGDGCSAGCAVEGTCDDPVLVEFEEDGFGTAAAVVTADTSSGGGTTAARACSGLSLGAGDDRTYLVGLTQRSDLTVTVEAEFDAIVRIYGSDGESVCQLDREAFCIDEVGAGETETFHYRGMPDEGAIVVTVDGAEPGEAGEYTLTITQGCDADHVKLHRLTPFHSGGNTAILSVKNTSEYCTVNLDTVGLTVTDDVALLPIDLPERALAPGEIFRGSFDVVPSVNPNAFDFEEVPNTFSHDAAGAYLCDGPCDDLAGANVMDALLTGTLANVQIAGTTFSPGPQDVGPTVFESHVRVAYDGVAPNFVASDWSPAFLVDPDDYIVDGFSYYNDGSSTAGTVSFVADPLEGTVAASGPSSIGSFAVYAGAVPATVSQPTYVSFTVRAPVLSPGGYSCFTSLGINDGNLGTSAGFGNSYGVAYAGPYHYYYDYQYYDYWYVSGNSFGASDTSWHTIEFENINWTNRTMDIRVDGAVLVSAAPMPGSSPTTVGSFNVRPWMATDGCQYSDITVRNGPPGRIWESPPVLVAPD